MKKFFIILLIFLFMGVSYSGDSPLPKIVHGKYEIQQRKGKTYFIDLIYEVKIQGKYKSYNGWLNVILYNEKGNEIESFGKQIVIKPKKIQIFGGSQMITIKVADEIRNVGFDLGIYQKKY